MIKPFPDSIGGRNGKPGVRRARSGRGRKRLDGFLRFGHDIYGDQRRRIDLQAQRAGAIQHRQQHAKFSHRLLDMTVFKDWSAIEWNRVVVTFVTYSDEKFSTFFTREAYFCAVDWRKTLPRRQKHPVEIR